MQETFLDDRATYRTVNKSSETKRPCESTISGPISLSSGRSRLILGHQEGAEQAKATWQSAGRARTFESLKESQNRGSVYSGSAPPTTSKLHSRKVVVDFPQGLTATRRDNALQSVIQTAACTAMCSHGLADGSTEEPKDYGRATRRSFMN